MPQVVDFNDAIANYGGRPNGAKFLRERVLGLDVPDFLRAMTARNSRHALSDETLRAFERAGKGSPATVAKVLTALKGLLIDAGFTAPTDAQILTPVPLPPPTLAPALAPAPPTSTP